MFQKITRTSIVLLGDGNAGKTSLINRMIKDSFDPNEAATHGIEITKSLIPLDFPSDEIEVDFWDFGGQQILHSLHRVFLTNKKVFLLVVDSRSGDSNIEFWLKTIKVYGGDDASIIVVLSKSDQHYLDIDRRSLSLKYPSIVSFVNTSARTGVGINKLNQEIFELITKELDRFTYEISDKWQKSMKALGQIESMLLKFSEFSSVLMEEGLPSNEIKPFTNYLSDLGELLYFEDSELKDYIILDSKWLIDVIAKLLYSPTLQDSKGRFSISTLNDLLDADVYPRETYVYLIQILNKFEFSFEIHATQEYLLTDMLPIKMPDFDLGEFEDSVRLNYRYDIFLRSIITRLIARFSGHLFDNLFWQLGLVASDGNNKALIVADPEERNISVSVTGLSEERRDFLQHIRRILKQIHSEIGNIQVQELIPIPQDPRFTISYSDLLTLEENGIEDYFVPTIAQKINVRKLLDGIDFTTFNHRQSAQVRLFETMKNSFDIEDLKTMSFYMGIETDRFPSHTKSEYLIDLIRFLEKRNQISDLVALCKAERPDLSWDFE